MHTLQKAVVAGPGFHKNKRIEQLFQHIVFACLEQISVSETGLAGKYDVESLHQLRVGLRRLRSAFRIFKDQLPIPPSLEEDLSWISSQLNPARDWDVLLGTTLVTVMDLPHTPALSRLMQEAGHQAERHHRQARASVLSDRFTLFKLDLGLWLHLRAWRDGDSAGNKQAYRRKSAKFASHRLADMQQQLQNAGQGLRKAKPRAMHKIRIEAKKLRYAMEFFKPVLQARQNKAGLKNIIEIQDQLGSYNDLVIAQTLLAEMQGEDPDLKVDMVQVCQLLEDMADKKKTQIRKHWKQLLHS
ncbi:CHAD domain-containing protein [Undibacterium sp. TJN19]|uniref:CHAD domain-containing protein n=1 Tax=Undibacterium sp. TJN19 TaxID=3413055 RepID=UPI003BF34CB1